MNARSNKLRDVSVAPTLNGKSTGEVKPLKMVQVGDDPAARYEAELADIESRKRALADDNKAREKEMADLVEAERQAFAKKQEARKREKTELRNLAKHYREMAAASEDRQQADELLRWAMECHEEAQQIIIEGEAEPVVLAASIEPEAWWERNRKLMAIGVVVLTCLLIWAMSEYFQMFRDMIIEQNKALPPEQQMQPYDRTSIQKLIFEKLVQATDLPVALLMLFIVMPPVAFYVLPFARSKPDFWSDFKTLTPAVRCTIATCFVLGFLLLAVLAHLVKS
ncbi:hypothetical protein [uncultured Fibrella sp.]|uniref:hypothetical protein n=1 Tax=uncultured Fibrella sp. TaxID=1284596 RepID=UPI0035CA9AB9